MAAVGYIDEFSYGEAIVRYAGSQQEELFICLNCLCKYGPGWATVVCVCVCTEKG